MTVRWLPLAAVLILVSIPSYTSAHTLTVPGASRVAKRVAAKNAILVSDLYDDVVVASVRRCERVNPHKVDCSVDYRFDERDLLCSQIYRIRFNSRVRSSVRVSYPGLPTCRPVG